MSKKFPNHIFLGLDSNGMGAVEIDPKNMNVKRTYFNTGNYDKLESTVQYIISDNDGDIWLAAYSGIYHVHFKGSDVTDFEPIHYDTQKQQINPISMSIIEGQVVAVGPKGLYKLVKNQNFKNGYNFVPTSTIGSSRIENAEKIKMIYGQNKNTLIVMTESKYALLRKDSDGHYHWDGNSLKKVEGTANEVVIEPDGTIWIGTFTSLYRYDPRVKKEYTANYNVLIRNIIVNHNEVLYEGGYYDLAPKNKLHPTKTSTKQPNHAIPILPYQKNNITFKYSAAFYEHPESNSYSYQLEGFDKDFSKWSNKSSKEYTNLYEGKYRFVVKAKNIFDQEGENKPPQMNAWFE